MSTKTIGRKAALFAVPALLACLSAGAPVAAYAAPTTAVSMASPQSAPSVPVKRLTNAKGQTLFSYFIANQSGSSMSVIHSDISEANWNDQDGNQIPAPDSLTIPAGNTAWINIGINEQSHVLNGGASANLELVNTAGTHFFVNVQPGNYDMDLSSSAKGAGGSQPLDFLESETVSPDSPAWKTNPYGDGLFDYTAFPESLAMGTFLHYDIQKS